MLPTAHCPHCKRQVLVYQDVGDSESPSTGALQPFCLDCQAPLERFGEAPVFGSATVKEAVDWGYKDLNRPQPVGPGGCFEDRGCEGCPKIDSRPW